MAGEMDGLVQNTFRSKLGRINSGATFEGRLSGRRYYLSVLGLTDAYLSVFALLISGATMGEENDCSDQK